MVKPSPLDGSNRIRVLQVVQNLNYGGMERLLADLVSTASHDRFEFHVLCLGYFGRFAEGLENVAQLHLARQARGYSMIWPASLIKQVKHIAPHVVHTHGGVWYKASLAARRARVPLLVHTEHGRHSPDPWQNRLIDKLAARRTDAIVAVSEKLIDVLEAGLGLDPSRVRVVHNGVNTEQFRPTDDNGALRRELGIPEGASIIGSVGRLEPVKQYDVMIRAFQHLRARWQDGPPPVLVLCGDGSERERILSLISEAGLGDSVHPLGWRDDIHDLHAAYTLFTMSSRSEGTSVSLLEAMSAGLCPIVTNVGGNSRVLGEELRHCLVPANDPTALADAWLRALGDRARLRKDAERAREQIIEAFSLKAMVSEYERIYSAWAQPRLMG